MRKSTGRFYGSASLMNFARRLANLKIKICRGWACNHGGRVIRTRSFCRGFYTIDSGMVMAVDGSMQHIGMGSCHSMQQIYEFLQVYE